MGRSRSLFAVVTRHRELALAATFVVMAAWELIEVVALELRHGAVGVLALALHSAQVLLVAGVTFAVIRAWQARTRHEERLARMVETVVMAQEEERRRIAYDLHDGIAQLIVSAKQHVETCRDLAGRDADRAERELAKAVERLQGAVVETRRVLAALRPSAVDSLGLSEAIRQTLEETAQEAGWTTRFDDGLGDVRLPPAVETAVFRIVQETLANAARHARSARVEIELGLRRQQLHLRVRDDGVGLFGDDAPGASRGLGLAGMRERARLLGGSCSVESVRSGGTCVTVDLPLGSTDTEARRA
jgi:signal transduction histidine kinase